MPKNYGNSKTTQSTNIVSNQPSETEKNASLYAQEMRLLAETQRKEPGVDLFQQEGYSDKPYDQGDIYLTNSEKLGKSLVAGAGDVMEQIIDLSEFAYNFATPFGHIEKSAGLNFSKNFFDWAEENTAGKLQEEAVKYRKNAEKEFQWSDMSTADFWTTDFARQVPNLLSMMAGGMGLAKGAGNLLLRGATKKLAKEGAEALGKQTMSKFNKGLVYGNRRTILGVGVPLTKNAIKKTAKGLELSRKGRLSAGVFAGAGMNLVDGGIVAGMAYDEALAEFGDTQLAAQVAGDIFLDNAKWMAVDAVSWAFTFGGGSKMLLPKIRKNVFKGRESIGGRLASTLSKPVRFAGATVPEGIEEMFQETYQEWIEKKAFNEARGEDDKTPTYMDFFNSAEARKTKAISLVSGLAGGSVGGYTNLVNDIAEREYEADKRIDSMMSIIDRYQDSETTAEKTEALYDMATQTVADENGDALRNWLNEEVQKEKSAVDERLVEEINTFLDLQEESYNKIGRGLEINTVERQNLYLQQTAKAKIASEKLAITDLYNENISDLDKEISEIEGSDLSDRDKQKAIDNINDQKEQLTDDYDANTNSILEVEATLQAEINGYTSKIIENSKKRKVTLGSTVKATGRILKSIIKSPASIVNSIQKGVSLSKDIRPSKEGLSDEELLNERTQATLNAIKQNPQVKKQLEAFEDEDLKNVIKKSFAESNYNFEIDEEKQTENFKVKLSENITKLAESKLPQSEETKTNFIGKGVNKVKSFFTGTKTETVSEKNVYKEEIEGKVQEKTLEEEYGLDSLNDLQKVALQNAKDSFDNAKDENKEVAKEKLDKLVNKLRNNKSRKPLESETTTKENPKEKKERVSFFSRLNPLIVAQRRIKKNRLRKEQNQKIAELKEKRRKQSLHYIYALKDANYPNKAIIPMAIVENAFGKNELGKKIGNVMYAKLGTEFYNTVKHEFSHVLWESFEGEPLMDKIIETIMSEKDMYQKVQDMYPENILYSHEFGDADTIIDIITNTEARKKINRNNPDLAELMNVIIKKHNTLQPYEAEAKELQSAINKSYNINKLPAEQQTLIQEEVFAAIIDSSDDITLDEMIGGTKKAKDSVRRRSNILLDKFKGNNTTEKNKINLLKTVDDEMQKIETLNDAFAIIKNRAVKSKKIPRIYRNSRYKSNRKILKDTLLTETQHKTRLANELAIGYLADKTDILNFIVNELFVKNNLGITKENFSDKLNFAVDALLSDALLAGDYSVDEFTYSNFLEYVRGGSVEGKQVRLAASKILLKKIAYAGVLQTDSQSPILKALTELGIVNEDSLLINKQLYKDETQIADALKHGDNPLAGNNPNISNNILDNFISWLSGPEGNELSKRAGFTFDTKQASRHKDHLRKTFARTILKNERNKENSFEKFREDILSSKDPILKAMTLHLEQGTEKTNLDNFFVEDFLKGIYHIYSSQVSERRDILILDNENNPQEYEDSMSRWEQSQIEGMLYQVPDKILIDDLVFTKENSTLNSLIGDLYNNELIYIKKDTSGDSIPVEEVFDMDKLKSTSTINIDNKLITVDSFLNNKKSITKNEIRDILESALQESRDWNQVTLVATAKINAMTSLLNKKSHVYQVMSIIEKLHSNEAGITGIPNNIKTLWENSVFEYMSRLGITPRLSFDAGIGKKGPEEIEKESDIIYGQTYFNLTADEVTTNDILRFVLNKDSDTYQVSYFTIAEKSRRPNVTAPKFKSLFGSNIQEEIDVILDIAEKIQNTKFKGGEALSQIFAVDRSKKGIINQLASTPKAKSALDSIVNETLKFMESSISTFKPFIENGSIPGKVNENGTISIDKNWVQSFEINQMINRFSAQELLISEHKNFENYNDYSKRSPMSIARKGNQFAPEIEIIVMPDFYLNKEDGKVISGKEYNALDDNFKKSYKIYNDGQSHITSEDKFRYDEKTGFEFEGTTLKTVGTGKDLREEGIESGDLYVKHNTTVFDMNLIEMAVENGDLTLAKYYAFVKERQDYLKKKYNKHIPIFVMSESSVKSESYKNDSKTNDTVRILDIRNVKLDKGRTIDTFRNMPEIHQAINNENINFPISSLDVNLQRDKVFAPDGKYLGLDGNILGVQSVLESNKNTSTSSVLVQQISNMQQNLPNQELIDISNEALYGLSEASAAQLDIIEDKIQKIKQGDKEVIQEFVNLKWAGYPMLSLIDKKQLNIPEVENKLREVLSKAYIFSGTKLRGPGGIAFEGSPIGINLKVRVPLNTLDYANNLEKYGEDTIVSEIILPSGMNKKFKVGDVIIASRVPADSPRHHQVVIVKDFGSFDAGQVTLLPPEISAILGSDKDADAIFFNGEYKSTDDKNSSLQERKEGYNKFVLNSIKLFGSPQMDNTMSLSLENIDEFAADVFEKMSEQKDYNKETLSLMFDNFAMKNNTEMRKILGVVATAIRDTNKLARYKTKLSRSITMSNGKTYDTIQDVPNENGDFDFANNVANLFNLILDNAAKQKAFTMGINQTVARDMVILLRMGFTPSEVFEWANSDIMQLTYVYDERATMLKKNKDAETRYTSDFLAYVHSSNKLNLGDNVLNIFAKKDLESFREEYNRLSSTKLSRQEQKALGREIRTIPTLKLTEQQQKFLKRFSNNPNPGTFETGVASKADKIKKIESISLNENSIESLRLFKLMRNVKSDIDSYSGMVNIYKNYPKTIMEAQSLLYDFNSSMENQKALMLKQSFKNDAHLLMLKNTLKEYIMFSGFSYVSTENINKYTDGLVKVLSLNKYNRGQAIINKIIDDITDNSIKSIRTDLNESDLTSLNLSLQDFIKNQKTDERILIVNPRTNKVDLNIDYINDDTELAQLNEIQKISAELFESKIDILGIGEVTVAEAMLMLEYNKFSEYENSKSRLKYSRKLLSILPDSYVSKINDELSNNSNKELNTESSYLLDILNDNKNIITPVYQNMLSSDTDIALDENGVNIQTSKFNSYKNIINALMVKSGNIYVMDKSENGKIDKLLDSGIELFPLLNYKSNEIFYLDLKAIKNDGDPKDLFKRFVKKEETTTESNSTALAKITKGTRGKSRKVIRDTDLRNYKPLDSRNDDDVRKYMDARGLSSLTNNEQVRLDAQKSMVDMKNAVAPIEYFLENYFNELYNYETKDLIDMAHSYSSQEIEPLAKQLIVKEISIALAVKAREEQVALNPEGYAGATDQDVSGIKKWLMSNDVDTNNPDVQYMTSIVEKEYFKYTQEYTRQARPIKVLANNLKKQARKELGIIQYITKWAKGELNRYIYRNIYDIKLNENGKEYIELKRNTSGMSQSESDFHAEFYRLMEETHKEYDYTVPYHTMNTHEALNRRGLYGMYMMSEGLESRLDSVPVYGKDPITNRFLKRSYADWKLLYEDKRINSNKFSNIKSISNIRKKAEELFDKGFDEDNMPITYSETSLRMLLGEEQSLNYVAGDNAKLPEYASWDLESIALKTLRTNIFNNGTENFAGFKRLGVLIDGILEYNESNPNIKEWVDTVYKKYLLQGKREVSSLGKTKDSIIDKFVLFTTLKVLGPWNLAIPVGNILMGKFNQLRASGLKKFVTGESRFINPANFKKNAAIIRNYVGYDMSMFEDFYSMQEKTPFDKIADIVMMPMEYSEKYIQGSGFLGYLTKEEYESIEVDDNGSVSGLSELRVQELNELVRKEQGKGYNVTNRRLMGMYATSRLLFQFKKYLPTLLVERFGKERVNRLGEYQIGSWTAASKSYGSLLTGSISYDDFMNQPDHVKNGTRKFKNGLVLSMLIATLADWDDDNEILNKLNNDVAMLRDTDKYKYRILPAAYWNIKSMVN